MSLRHQLAKLPDPVKRAIKDRVYPKLLPEGETAPEWHLQSYDNSWHRQGRHWSLMVFYVEDGGEVDRQQLLEVQKFKPDFDRLGVKVFACSNAEAEPHEAFAKELGLDFPVLVDRGGSVARQFKACMQVPGASLMVRTVYLVNPERKIRLGNRGTPSIEAIVRSVEALQQASKTGM